MALVGWERATMKIAEVRDRSVLGATGSSLVLVDTADLGRIDSV